MEKVVESPPKKKKAMVLFTGGDVFFNIFVIYMSGRATMIQVLLCLLLPWSREIY